MKITLLITILTLSLLISGCASKQALLESDMMIASGEYKKAVEFSNDKIDKNDLYAKDNLLWYLQNGSANLYANDNNKSIKAFDKSEQLIKYYREQILAKDIAQTLKSTLLNDTTRPYIGTEYDGVMVNTYKAIDYMQKGDTSSARVEFNRAIDRQRRAKIFYSKMIYKEREAIKRQERESAKEGKNLNVDKSTIDNKLESYYPSLHAFEPYPNYINPMTTYLAGLFASANDDTSKAQTLLKESFYMMKENSDVKADFDGKREKQTVWLIFENGQAPLLKELKIDFPIWIFSNNLSFISVALPKLVERKVAFTHLNLLFENQPTLSTKYLCSMDRVIKTEFASSYSSTVERAILSAATKAAISYTLNENSGNSDAALLMKLATAIYTVASTKADTRTWSTLPKEFQLARFSRPMDGKVSIFSPNNTLIKNLTLADRDNILIYVKIATPYAKASVKVIPF